MFDQSDDDSPLGGGFTRRSFLTRAAGGAFAASSAAGLLAACGGSSSTTTSAATGTNLAHVGPGGIPIPTKTHPVKMPIYADNKPIPSGMSPEKGPLVLFDWSGYHSPAVIKTFEKKYGVPVQANTYTEINEATKKLTTGAIAADIWVPDIDYVLNYVASKLIKPINHSYIPNLSKLLPGFQSPWYDVGSQYTVANYIFSTGILWRNDLIKIDPASMSNPWSVFWQTNDANGKMGLQSDDPFDPISLALLHRGIDDFPNVTQAQINQALKDLHQLVDKGAKLEYISSQPLANGTVILAQGYNGDAFLVPSYLPKGTSVKALSYFFPKNGHGSLSNDYWSIPKTSKNPVLAHMWLNHILEEESAIENFRYAGYQVPLNTLSLDALKAAKVADPYILDMIYVTPTQVANGIPNPIPTQQQNEWVQSAFAALTSGAA